MEEFVSYSDMVGALSVPGIIPGTSQLVAPKEFFEPLAAGADGFLMIINLNKLAEHGTGKE